MSVSGISVRPGSARISVEENWDTDDLELTYELYRQGTSAPVGTQVGRTPFWRTGAVVPSRTPARSQAPRSRTASGERSGRQLRATGWVDVEISDGTVSDYAEAVLDDTPFLYWPFQETSGTTAADWAGVLPGTISSGVTLNRPGATSDADAKSFGFNGTSTGLVATQSAIPGPQVFTVEAWFRTTTTTGGKIVGFGNATAGDSGSYDRHIYMQNDGRLRSACTPAE